MNIGAGFYNLWLILVIVGAFALSLWVIGNKLRGVKIDNPEDHYNPKVIIVSAFPLLAFLGVSIFTPIVTGTLFWIGCVLLIIAGIMESKISVITMEKSPPFANPSPVVGNVSIIRRLL